MGYQIDIAVSGAGRLGEGLVWDDDEDQLLWWVDITGGLIHSYDISSRSNTSYDFGEPVGSIGRREAGGLVVAAKSGFYFFDPASGQKTPIADPEADIAENRFNDGTIDPAGRFWAGTMKDGGEPNRQGCFYLLDHDLSVRPWDQVLYTTNGLAFSLMAAPCISRIVTGLCAQSGNAIMMSIPAPLPVHACFSTRRHWPAGRMAALSIVTDATGWPV